jgi:hypothetical protein
MAEDIAGLKTWDFAAIQVKVGSADGGGSDSDNNVVRFLNYRIGHGFDANVVTGVIDESTHGWLSKICPDRWAGIWKSDIDNDVLGTSISVS